MTDFHMFDAYRRDNTSPNGNNDYCDVDYLLRLWREAKGQYLTKLFGDQLIIERPIEYVRSNSELDHDMEEMIEEQRLTIDALQRKLYSATDYTHERAIAMRDTEDLQVAIIRYLAESLTRCYNMVSNLVDIDTIYYYQDHYYDDSHARKSVSFKIGDNVISIQHGQKLTRLWGQIARLIGAEEDWERFRIAHSQVLNQKKLKGTLCLSIHPLDYATASDNDNGWSSCMSWKEDGCYRLGTVEMMNSPMVICAYLRSDKQHMSIVEKNDWNSKKWRAWIIVTKDAIVCNRHYPYHQAEFAKQAIQWVRELVGQQLGWQYDEIHENFYDYMEQEDCEIEYRTNYMYNDLGGDDVIGCLNIDHHNPGSILFSGAAECMVCGSVIPYDQQGADHLECSKCYSEYECESCGCSINNDEVFWGPNGEALCESCYNEQCCICSDCGETIWQDDAYTMEFPIYKETAKRFWNNASPEFKQRFRSWTGKPRFPSSIGDDVCLCNRCAQRYHIHAVSWDSSEEVKCDYTMNVPDPNKADMNRVFDVMSPEGWGWAHSYWVRYADDSREEADEIINFWAEQWEHFKADFNSIEATED